MKEYLMYLKSEVIKNAKDLKSTKTIYRQIPNLLTFFRAIAPIPINIFFFIGNIYASLGVCAVAAITDLFDGKIARKFNIKSQFGADLDAICDKILIGGIALPIIIQNPIMIINILLEAGISATNINARLKGNEIKSTMIGKIKTWILSITVLLGYLPPLLNINVSLLTAFLATIPATIFQSATLIKYLEINNNRNNDNNDTNENKTPTEVLTNEITNNNEYSLSKTLTTPPATKEELKELRDELTAADHELGYQKSKNRFN